MNEGFGDWADAGDGETIRVLHVDDDPGFAELTAEFLELESDAFEVVSEHSVAAGLERVAAGGIDEEALLGRTIPEFAPPDHDFDAAWRAFQQSGRDRGLFPLQRADGERRTVEFAATHHVLPNRHLSVLRDVTTRELDDGDGPRG